MNSSCRQILVIEDESDLRETLKDLLELCGFTVVTAANGLEGLACLRAKGAPCLILLDLMMPIMSGWEFLEAVQNEHQQLVQSTPVVIVSAAADLLDIQEKYGCQVMKKPPDIDQLLALATAHCGNTMH